MKLLRFIIVFFAIVVILAFAAVSVGYLNRSRNLSAGVSLQTAAAAPSHAEIRRYRLDAAQSKFIAQPMAGGLLWFKGHDHLVAVREFTGEAQLTRDQANGSSLEINAKAASMVESSTVFTDQQKQIIDKELREIVLQPEQYPDIVFRSTQVGVKQSAADQYDLDVTGNLTLHGVTRQITIPTKVTVTASDLRAVGEFSIDRSDFNVKATSAFHGLVRVRDKVKFNFDIVGHQL